MRWQGFCYRAHDPKWAWAPISGAGAAAKGGRFNPTGVPTLYLALTLEGMFLEMSHGFAHRFEPLTICTYEVDMDDLADLRSEESRSAEGVSLADMACAWALDVASGTAPASWAVCRKLMAEGYAGLLAPSFANGAKAEMINLVLWNWGVERPHQVKLHDPANRLPKDQSSWEAKPDS